MGEEDACAVVRCRIGDDRLHGEAGTACIAVMTRQMEAVQLPIDVHHPQALSSGIGLGNAAGEERSGRIQSVQLERPCGTLKAHPA